ncbi:MAG: DinB family protein [Candidatus Bathyarchaeia archaeon]
MLSYQDLFDYFKKEREGLVHIFETMSEEEFTKNRGLSFDSIKDVFVHTVIVEDNWLHYRAAGLGESTQKVEDFRNLQEIMEYITEVDTKTTKLFNTITSNDLKKGVKRVPPDGKEIVYQLGDVLYHIPIEIIHHYGEIFAELWKINNNAPYYSYLDYTGKNRSM